MFNGKNKKEKELKKRDQKILNNLKEIRQNLSSLSEGLLTLLKIFGFESHEGDDGETTINKKPLDSRDYPRYLG